MTDTFSTTGALLAQAAGGNERAWNELVSLHSRLLWSVARSYRLDQADAADVVQTAWLRLLEHLDSIQDPTRLVGWLVTTTRRECLRVLRRSGRERLIPDDDAVDLPDPDAEPIDAALLTSERNVTLWEAFCKLPEHCQRLLRIAVAVPRTYQEISAELEVPVGYIGPTRGRCLGYLRKLLAGTGLTDFSDGGGTGAQT
jgi:RNA polymerase sigma factor (sigma-70 family)